MLTDLETGVEKFNNIPPPYIRRDERYLQLVEDFQKMQYSREESEGLAALAFFEQTYTDEYKRLADEWLRAVTNKLDL